MKDGGEENGVKEELTSSHDVNEPLVVGLIFKNKLGRTCGLKRATAFRPLSKPQLVGLILKNKLGRQRVE